MSDNCCSQCKGPFGICRDRQCFHRIEVQALEDKDSRDLRLYRDPTPAEALRNMGRRNG